MWWQKQKRWNSEAFIRRTNRALARQGSVLQVDENLLVEGGEHLASVDFDGQLTLYAHGFEAQTLDLPRPKLLVTLLRGWCEWNHDADQLAANVKGFEPSDRLRLLTMDLAGFVAQCWQQLAESVPHLAPLLRHFHAHAQLGTLFPFEDQDRLGLSPTVSNNKRVLKEQALLMQPVAESGYCLMRETTVWPDAGQRQIPQVVVSEVGRASSVEEAVQLTLQHFPADMGPARPLPSPE